MTISCPVIWKQPSPSTQTTVASGRAALAPIAAGMPKPIVPRPPEVMKLRGRSQRRYCIAHIWCWPTPVVKTTSSRPAVRACSVSSTCLRLQHLAVCPVAERELVPPVGELAQPALRHGGTVGAQPRDLACQLGEHRPSAARRRGCRHAGACRSRPSRRRGGRRWRRARTPTACPSRGRRNGRRRRRARRTCSCRGSTTSARASRASRSAARASRGRRSSPSAS